MQHWRKFKPLAIAQGNKLRAALVLQNGRYILWYRRNSSDSEWHAIELKTIELGTIWSHLLIYEEGFLLVTRRAIYTITGSGKTYKTEMSYPQSSKGWLSGPPSYSPITAAIATEGILFLGYDGGEYGGALMALKINRHGKLRNFECIMEKRIRAIRKDSTGAIWIGTDSGQIWRWTPTFSLNKQQFLIQKIVDYSATAIRVRKENLEILTKEGLAITKSGRGWNMGGMAIDSEDKIISAIVGAGIFSFAQEGFINIEHKGELTVDYTGIDGAIVDSVPVALVAKDERLFVAYRTTGVIVFERKDNSFVQTRQFVFSSSTSE